MLDGSGMRFVASRCGFDTQAYMTAVFKKKLGRTPGSYRKAKPTHPRLMMPPAAPKDGVSSRYV
jgi:AraC-like DNA-binding protein